MKLSRTRAHVVALSVALLLLGAGTARADQDPNEQGMNLHQVYLPLDGHGFYVVDEPQTLDQWQLHGFVNYSYADRPLDASLGESASDEVVEHVVRRQDMLDVGAAIGLLPKDFVIPGLSVGFDIPLDIVNHGEILPDLDRSLGSGGVGQMRLQAKADLLELKDDAAENEKPFWQLSLGASTCLTLPTGRPREDLSDQNGCTGGFNLLAAFRLWRFRFGGQFGYEATPHIVLGDVNVRDRLRWGVAIEFMILNDEAPWADNPKDTVRHTIALGGELFGWTDAWHTFGETATRPVEGLLYIRYAASFGLTAEVAYGNGINHGVSAPFQRFMVNIGWTFG